jgi:hypothetical protein
MADLPTLSSILTDFEKHRRQGERIATPYRRLGSLCESFVAGRQFGAILQRSQQVVNDEWFKNNEAVPRAHINICQGLMTTFSALLNKDRRSALATPTTPDDPEDIYSTEITNRVIDYVAQEQKTAAKIHQAVQYAFQDGTAGVKVWPDEFKGEVRWARLTIHDYIIDPVEDWHDAKWVIFENHYTEDEVAEMWEAAKLPGSPPDEQDYQNAAGETVSGVLGHEYWQRPCRKYPDGFFVVVIGGEVVVRKVYPLIINTEGDRKESLLPLALMKVRFRRDSAYGITPLADVINLQRLLNETHARTIKVMRQVTNKQIAMPKDLADQVNITQGHTLGYDPKMPDAKSKIFALDLGAVGMDLYKLRDDARAFMFEVVGLNEVTSGGEAPTLSGRAIEAYYELDSQKNSDALKSLEDMVLDAWRLCLAIIQLFYPVERTAEIVRMDAIDLVTFSGKDIQGKNIRLEASSEMERRTDVRAGKATEALQAGTGTPEELAAAQKTAPNAIAKQAASLAVRAYLAADDVEINARDHSIPALKEAIDREKSRAISTGRRSDFVDLVYLETLIRDQIEGAAVDEEAPAAPAPEEQPMNAQAVRAEGA